MKSYGPQTPESEKFHQEKYRAKGESFREAMTRVANPLSDNAEHFKIFRDILLQMKFLPGGRIQRAIGSLEYVTPYNCYVSGTIEDSLIAGQGSIMQRATQAAATMQMGGGIGYDFSTLRPRGALIKKLGSQSSGPVPFMGIFNATCLTISSAGSRRGAQMGMLRVDHPDIEEFIRAKQNKDQLTGFNLSVAVTDEFMQAVLEGKSFALRFGGQVYREIDARSLWETLMRSTYDWAEPGVIFIDRINEMNNLHYCETIAATNPCGEQPLPPFGACLLGSINLVQYLERDSLTSPWKFNYEQLCLDIPYIVRAMDNVIDIAKYPLYEQEQEAQSKRRMGIGITGAANAIEALGSPYGSEQFISRLRLIMEIIRDTAYGASVDLAIEKGAFPKYDREKYLQSKFIQTLPTSLRERIAEHGIRNSHLLSIAPTGSISYSADNISSGIEPVFDYRVERTIIETTGTRNLILEDYGASKLGVRGKIAARCNIDDHLSVLIAASEFVDSAVSKTCNVPQNIEWEDFKDIYIKAWQAGCKGCTTYRTGGLRNAVIKSEDLEASSCTIDPISGRKSCE